ncbi:hypothetical protein LO762_18720 [Actinocorallia sp. API 0066]|uniref:hypothetical protein n=1 Tax=Actinocorallia sp. API 0066 TaxID=2896846 RepID=UPI001E5CED0F|nr:hypothetical protein [Actinocorallia sp. API 0066]MCD0451215.1 hypothetical protein [Actinocorallia sp. API 0066]
MRFDRADLLGGDIPLRPLSAAEMLDAALALLRRSPRAVLGPAFAVVGAVQLLVTLAAYFLVGGQATGEVTPHVLLRSFGSQAMLTLAGSVIGSVAVLLLAGAYAPVIARGYFGLGATPRGVWRDVRPRLGRLLVLALGVPAGVLAVAVLPLLPFIAVVGTDGSAALGILLAVVGFPAGFFLVVWLGVATVLAAPALVLERLGPRAALARSWRLVGGQWWRTFMVLALTLLIAFLMGGALRLPFVVVEMLFFGGETGGQAVAAISVDTLGRIVSTAITTPFQAGVIALMYLDRRHRREGLDLEIQRRDTVPDDDLLTLWAGSR